MGLTQGRGLSNSRKGSHRAILTRVLGPTQPSLRMKRRRGHVSELCLRHPGDELVHIQDEQSPRSEAEVHGFTHEWARELLLMSVNRCM